MKNRQKTKMMPKRLLSLLLTAAMAVTLLPTGIYPAGEVKAEGVTLSNPRIVADSSMEAGQKVTWDCVWFGNYPQAKVVASGEYMGMTDRERQGRYIVSDSLYRTLENAEGWDSNNDIILNGTKYHRREYFFQIAFYFYYQYEPIKWRVLQTDGKQALLLSDVALEHNRDSWSVIGGDTWENSVSRSFLNGYGAGSNYIALDCSRKNFIDSAFTAAEQATISDSTLENADNIELGTECGNNTTDKIFRLSESDVWNTGRAEKSGFVKSRDISDEARRCKASTYVSSYSDNCYWALRTLGFQYEKGPENLADIMNVDMGGRIHNNMIEVAGYINTYYERPALNLNLSSSNLYTYAGTVCSDGTVNEKSRPVAPGGDTPKPPADDKPGNESVTSPVDDKPGSTTVIQPPAMSSRLKDASGAVYTVTKSGGSGGTVTYTKSESDRLTKAAVPAEVTSGGITYQVTAIAANAFSGCSKLKSVSIGKNVTAIGAKAFYKCTSLTKLTIPASVGKIGKQAFGDCKKLKKITIKTRKLTKKNVGKKAFKGIHPKAVIKVPKNKRKAYQKLLKARGAGRASVR